MSFSLFVSHAQGVLLVLMMIIFGVIALWAYAPKNRARMDERARIPMRDED